MQRDPRTDWRTPHFWVDRLLVAILIVLLRGADLVVLLLRPRLLFAYLRLRITEIWASPYAIEPLTPALIYGETPVVTALWIFRRAGLRRGHRLLDLGAGRGIPLLAARFLGAEARGVESLDEHVTAASPALRFAGADLVAGDLLKTPWENPSHVYLAWNCFAPTVRSAIEERLGALEAGTRVIAVDKPLEHPRARLRDTLRLPFPWGWTRVWLYEL